ncbi:MAG: hypothetical protein ACM3QS_05280 [Bacteroidota bacterium]
MFRRSLTFLSVLIVALSLVSGAAAQSYSFRVEREVVNVSWNADGTMALDYVFSFSNEPGGHVIDFVDVGLPNNNYALNTITADVDGAPVSVSTDYQGSGSGVAIDLGSHAIGPGQAGDVHVSVGRISGVMFRDTGDQSYASAVFSPTYFDAQFVNGQTDLTVTFQLPPGIQPEEPRWHAAPSGFPDQPETALDAEGRVTYTWRNPQASADREYRFGASFPRMYVPQEAVYAPPPAPASSPDSGEGVFDFLCGGGMEILFFIFFALLTAGGRITMAVQGQRRKLKYMPPRVAIEGHGIKRGLTAVEAAILMEQPLDKVLTMILFGLVKKGAARVTSRNPLAIEALKPAPEGIFDYEKQFLEAFARPERDIQRYKALQDLIVALVRQVSEKMRGFSRGETIDYYQAIMERAWQAVEAADTPEVKGQKIGEGMEWTMLDPEYDRRMDRTIRGGRVFVPNWWGQYDPSFGAPSIGSAGKVAMPSAPSVSPAGPRSLPGADFAASVVNGVQNFSSRVLGDVGIFTSGVTDVINPLQSGGGHVGGCACACACAGCACACAGGGR